jgi:acid phosphatase (class A)
MKRTITIAALTLVLYGCAVTKPVPEVMPGILAPYLGQAQPDSLALLPPPPADGSAAKQNDEAVHAAAQALKGSPRYALAALDADLAFPHAVSAFSCSVGAPISEADAPRTYLLMRRVFTDAGFATFGAKNHYQRVRPFVQHDEGTCAPADEASLRKDGSYPSGHTSIGWAWALVLTELVPERRNELLARGRAYGESRLVCNAHWQSDVLEGRAIAAGTVAQLHSNAQFTADMAAAKKELDSLRSRGAKPNADCAAEAAALAVRVPGVL